MSSTSNTNFDRVHVFSKSVNDAIAILSCKFVWAVKQLTPVKTCRIKIFKILTRTILNADLKLSIAILCADSVALQTIVQRNHRGGTQLHAKNGHSLDRRQEITTFDIHM